VAFTSGTIAGGTAATNHTDLLSKIRTFCTTGLGASNWSEIKWAMNGSEREWMFIAPGLSGSEQIFGGIRTRTSGTYSNLEIAGYFGNYGSNPSWDTDFTDQPLAAFAYVTCSADPMDYWIVANGQRLICLFRSGSIWSMFHLGKILPYGSASEYPYPFFLAGTNSDGNAQTSDVAGHRHFANPTTGTAKLYLPGNLGWASLENYNSSDNPLTTTNYIKPTSYGYFGSAASQRGASQANPDGSVNMIPYEILVSASPGGLMGRIDGAYWCSGLTETGAPLVAGSIIDTDYIVFPNISRTAWHEWSALRLA